MSNILSSIVFIDGVQYFLDSTQAIKRVLYFDGNQWALSSEMAIQSSAPNPAVYKWWLDTSFSPPKFKYYDGTVWKVVNMVY
jgi:hypothetical protein